MRSLPIAHRLLILSGLLAGAFFWKQLPEEIPPSPGLGRAMVAFLLPAAAAVIYFLLRGLTVRHANANAGRLVTFDAIMLRLVAFVIGVHVLVVFGTLGALTGYWWADRIVPVMLGVTIVSIGNLLPRMQVHHAVAYATVAFGAVIILSALTVPPPTGPAMILAVGPVALVAIPVLVRSSRSRARA